MIKSRSARRQAAAGLLVLATACGLVASAPSAVAATTASCQFGVKLADTLTMPSTCAGFADQGAPYVFQIDTASTLDLWGHIIALGKKTYTCSAYHFMVNGSLQATGCSEVA
jgi:hypothetical protein